jgi:hypothetical protein
MEDLESARMWAMALESRLAEVRSAVVAARGLGGWQEHLLRLCDKPLDGGAQ